MAIYKCNSCGMSVKTLCGSCDEPLVDGLLTTDDGKEVQISECRALYLLTIHISLSEIGLYGSV